MGILSRSLLVLFIFSSIALCTQYGDAETATTALGLLASAALFIILGLQEDNV